ncbi:MAG: sensor histidine kinase [Segetibacter sp.]
MGFALQYRNRKRAEKDRQYIQMLQNEIHHRVKNNLGVIQRLVDVAGKNAVDDVPLSSLKTRIKSIELLHTHLYNQKAKPGNISLQAYLEDLCLAIATTFETGKDIKIEVNASEELNSDIAEKIGLIVNELVTNSYKYAFEGKDEGIINITAQKIEKNIQIAVEDNGVGFETEKNKAAMA